MDKRIHPMVSTRKPFRFFLWCTAAPVLLLGFFELFVRLFFPSVQPQGTDKILYAENRYGESHGLRPGAVGRSNGALVHVDENGFRITSIRPDATKKGWLLLGDSVTMGIGVEEDSTFAGILQSRFRRVNIFNPSMIGYHVRDYGNVFHYFLEARKNDLKIHRILLFWCLNDLYSDHDAVEMPGGKIRLRIGKVLNGLRVHSRLYHFIKTILFDRPKSYFLFDSRIYTENRQQVLDGIHRLLEIRNACSQLGIPFTVVLMPYEYQIRMQEVAFDASPQRIMMAEMKARGIDALDPLQFFKSAAIKSGDLFLHGDGIHLSVTGHRVMSDFLSIHLRTYP
jgi:hypothetical protein